MRLTPIKKKINPLVKRSKNDPNKITPTRKVNKKKNARTMRVYADYFRFFLGFIVIALICVSWLQEYPQRVYSNTVHGIHKLTTTLGFKVQEIVVQGRVHTQQQDLMKALKISRGDSIFSIDLQQVRFRLEKLEWIRRASVVRSLPDIIHIKIEERHPIAIWQHHNQFNLVDEDGSAILTKDYRNYGVLPLVVGEGAPQKSPDILKTLMKFPNIQKNLQALSRVHERRWNIYLVGGVLVKLSDHSLDQGLTLLERLLAEQRLSVKNIQEVDLRSSERYFLRVTPETIQKIKSNRKGKIA